MAIYKREAEPTPDPNRDANGSIETFTIPESVINGELFVEMPDGTVQPGWKAEGTYFDDEGVEQVTVRKGESTMIIPLAELDGLQGEMYEQLTGVRETMGGNALGLTGVEEPSVQERAKITVVDPDKLN